MQTFVKKYSIHLLTFLAVALAFCFLVDVFNLIDRTIFFIFQNRDIMRGRAILSGQMIFHGPEMTGGGHLPGSLYYYFLAISQWLNQSWLSAWILQCLFTVIGCFLGLMHFKKNKNELAALLWFIAFTLAPFTSNFLKLFLNVSMMIPFTVISIVLLEKIYDSNISEKKRDLFFGLACFFIGLGLHFHFSIICIYLAFGMIQFFANIINLPKISMRGWINGTLLLLIPLLPYFFWWLARKFGFEFGSPSFYAGNSSDAPKSLIHLLTYGYSEPYLDVLWRSILSVIPFPLIILFLILFYELLFEKSNSVDIKRSHYKSLLVVMLISFILVLEYTLSPQAYRYTMPFYLAILFFEVHLFTDYTSEPLRAKKITYLAVPIQLLIWSYVAQTYTQGREAFFIDQLGIILFVVFSIIIFRYLKIITMHMILPLILFSTLSFSQHRLSMFGAFTSGDWSLFMPSYDDWKQIWNTIYQETGWSYADAKHKIYYIGHHLEQDPDLALEKFAKSSLPLVAKDKQPDGFFISNRFRTKWKRWENVIEPERQWILGQNIQPEIKEAIEHDDIVLGKNLSNTVLIVPFWVKIDHFTPKHFHNSGQGYLITENDFRLTEITEAEGVKKVAQNEYIFKWNECPDQHAFCSTGALVKIDKTNETLKLSVKVIGATMAQITPWVSPTWTQAWINPYMAIKCNSEEEKIFLATSIGFLRKNSQDTKTPILQGNNSFVAPFIRNIEFQCQGKLTSITLGREKSVVEMITSTKELSAKKLSVEFKDENQ